MDCPEINTSTMERLVPDRLADQPGATGAQTLHLHLERYEFACRHARLGRLLDLACGVGYGSEYIASHRPDIAEIVGVDISSQAVNYARQRYANPRIQFVSADAADFHDPSGFDTIVSLETLEHVPDAAALVRIFLSLLRPNGIMICSAPITPSMDANPHHLRDFTRRSFERLFTSVGLTVIDRFEQNQPFTITEVINPTEPRMQHTRPHLVSYYMRHPGSALRRVWSTMVDGLTNRYLTLALKRQ